MNLVTLDEPPMDAAVPPPPPPIYAEKPRGKKDVEDVGLTLLVDRLPKTADQCALKNGGTLWLRDVGGQWRTGPIDDAAFEAARISGKLFLLVTPAIDPIEVLIQPKNESWAQRVELDTLYMAALSSASASPSP